MRLADVSILTKIMGVSVVTLAAVAAAIIFYLLPFIGGKMLDERVRATRQLVESMDTLMESYRQEAAAGRMSMDEAKRQAFARIRDIRFDGENYFWIADIGGVMRMHPVSLDLENKNVLDMGDSDGKLFFRSALEMAARDGVASVEYKWPHPGSTKPVPKISVVRLFRPWDMVVSAGVYVDDVSAEITALKRQTIAICLAGMMLLLVVNYLVARRISDPVLEATSALDRLALGDVSHDVGARAGGEVGRMLAAMQRMIQAQRDIAAKAAAIADGDLSAEVRPLSDKDVLGPALARMIEALRAQIRGMADGAQVLAAAAAEISTSVEQLAASSGETSVSVNETMAAMEELRQSAQLATDKARSLTREARETREHGHAGKSATEEAVTGMRLIHERMTDILGRVRELGERTASVEEIVEAVGDLADQSNVLAVNAAIEAAKAEGGATGFEELAREMRSLADQSKQATVRVQRQLAEIRKGAETAASAAASGEDALDRGYRQATLAGSSIEVLDETIARSSQSSDQIAEATEQQLSGIEQVVQAVRDIQRATDQNALTASQLRQEARHLHDLGGRLQALTSRYRLS